KRGDMDLIQIILVAVLFLIIIVVADYIKNSYKFELLIERLFRNFLRIEKTAMDFSKNFFNALSDEMRKVFLSDICFFFSVAEDKIIVRSASVAATKNPFNLKMDMLKKTELQIKIK